MSAKRKATAVMQHHKVRPCLLDNRRCKWPSQKIRKQENISTPEPADIADEEHYQNLLMKDPDKLKLMLLAWNCNIQAQAQALAQAQVQAANAALSPNNSSTTTTATTVGTPVTSQSAISTANNTINNSTLTDTRNGSSELGDLPASAVTSLGAVAGVGGEDMASLWASYAMSGFKKTPPPASSATLSRSDRDRESSPPGGEGTGSAHDETSSSGNKEEDNEDDDDMDVDEGLDPRHHDPERLKAFNMFVRLFVDENLDRIVPISKQPKEKIQAIIDSCTRQFPEFAERARKRIRTYLKSCRRNKRGREGAPWDAARPTPAHLTSVQAEQILATACENESENAKRMRLGMDPVSQPMPTLPAATQTDVRSSLEHFSSTPVKSLPIKREDTPPASLTSLAPLTSLANLPSSTLSSTPLSLASASKLLTPADNKSLMSQATIVSSSTVNGVASGGAPTAMYRPNFSQAFQRAGPTTVPPTLSSGLYPTQSFTSGLLSNGPTDLSMKNTKPLLSHKLNATEMTAVRQLITGYRESAAFLLRSADELEQLLLQQP
ncbi:nucleolar protein 4-like isoform X2 [Pseudomyrmex gracilis]|uniref:nucleolar protein 4-like isoform X2 n=1 Tax=Pseudomyrmex gracilis TaxID=219809 RepID=UPI000994C1B0|nr:nucleolar protein 4-like isoform X2 [Pseudomyrmex gracilis]